MESFVIQQLVLSIVKFLRQQVESSNTPENVLNEEGSESVEVALQCLEAAYNLSPSSELNSTQSLYEIFNNAVQAAGTSDMETEISFSEADKLEAELLKIEGNLQMQDKKFNEAVISYTGAIEKAPSNAAYYCNRAAAYSKLNNHQKAITDCKKALKLDPNRSKTYSRMGLAYTSLDDAAEAKQCYIKALEIDPENDIYQNNLQLMSDKLQSQNQQPSSSSNSIGNVFSGLGAAGVGLGQFASMAGMDGSGAGSPNMANIFTNPNLMSMASQLMTDPNMQNMLSSLFGGQSGGSQPQQANSSSTSETAQNAPPSNPPSSDASASSGGMNVDFLLNAGVQLAEQMQAQNPQLVEQLRSQLSRSNLRRDQNQDRTPPS